MNTWQTLADALREEDRCLRGILAANHHSLRSNRRRDDILSFKAVFGHIAYWDDFAVKFFRHRQDPARSAPQSLLCCEENSRRAMAAAAAKPLVEVFTRYLEVTGGLLVFVREGWPLLSPQERRNFWVTVKHRRYHRLALVGALSAAKMVADAC